MRSYQINNQLHLTTYIPSLAESYFLREGFMKLGILMQGVVYFCILKKVHAFFQFGKVKVYVVKCDQRAG